MHAFADLDDVQETLERLIERELVARLARRPGQKEERYAQLLEAPRTHAPRSRVGASGARRLRSRMRRRGAAAERDGRARARSCLSERVARLEREVAELRAARRASADAGAESR